MGESKQPSENPDHSSEPRDARRTEQKITQPDQTIDDHPPGLTRPYSPDDSVSDEPGTTKPSGATPTQTNQAIASRSVGRINVSDYEVLDEIGRGGMGVVYKARQFSLNRTVALKMIAGPVHVDAEALERFQREAKAIAKVQHPNIVQIYEIGDNDGLPFLSLEFIEGGSLDRLAAGQQFSANDVADLMRTLANAIHFAHERGVVHRDLKPANILMHRSKAHDPSLAHARPSTVKQRDDSTLNERPTLGHNHSSVNLQQFTPKITDFGLAKQLEDDSTATRSGSVMGTPSYMSPEQAAGRTREIGPLADVYALGATLYYLLTGRPPFRAESIPDTLRLVVDSAPIAPRLLNPTLDRDLDTICLKCLEKEPKLRYASAQALADELERYCKKLPIEARPLSAVSRAWRHCKRRPLVSSLAILFVLALVSGFAVSSFFAVLANNRATLAEKRRIAAEEAAGIAREQSELALNSLESVIFDIQRKLENTSGTAELRRSLLKTTVDQLKKVSDKFASKGAIDRNTAAALNDLGDVLLRVGNDIQDQDSDGPLAAALEAYQRAMIIAEKLATTNPTDIQAQLDLSISYNKVGDVQLQTGHSNDAIQSYQKGLEIVEKATIAEPGNAMALHGLAMSYDKVGDMQYESGKIKDALTSFESAFHIKQQLVQTYPNDYQTLRDLSISYGKIGDAHQLSGQLNHALTSYRTGLKIREDLAASHPNNPQAQIDLSYSYGLLGDVQRQAGQISDSLSSYLHGQEILEKLAGVDPNDLKAVRNLSFSYLSVGHVQLQLGEVKNAITSYGKGLEIRQKLSAADPRNAQAKDHLSSAYNSLGNAQLRAGRTPDALASYQKAFEIKQELASNDPDNMNVQRGLSISCNNLGSVQLRSGQLDGALASYEMSLEISQQMSNADPNNTQLLRDVSVSHNKVGDVLLDLRRPTDAIESYEKGLDIREKLASADATDARAQRDVAVSYGRLGRVQLGSGKLSDAHESYERSMTIRQRLADMEPSDARAQRDLALAHNDLGDIQLERQQVTAALKSYEESMEINQRLAAANKSDSRAQRDVMVVHFRMGEVRKAAGKYQDAVTSYLAGAEVLNRMIENGMSVESSKRELAILKDRARSAELAAVAFGDWEKLLVRPDQEMAKLLEMRGIEMSKRGQTEDAVRAALKLRELSNALPAQLYNAACVLSVCANSIMPEKGDELNDDQSAQRSRWVKNALETLKRAVSAGWSDFAHMEKDPDLAILRGLPEFKELVAGK